MSKWIRLGPLIIEIFVLANLSFLALDIFIAHSANAFSHPAEWIPFYFSVGAPLLLVLELGLNWRAKQQRHRLIGFWVGGCSSVVGIAGLLWHLNGSFFEYQTLKSLVYTAPFIAPLAYTGLGCLLIMNRMVKHEEMEWSLWLVFFGLGGFFGNFVLALCDHAQNGFFVAAEWISVIASAFAVSFLVVAVLRQTDRLLLKACVVVMFFQILVGLLGFGLHLFANLRGPATSLASNFIYGAPLFAPLLFTDLAILALIGLWDMVASERVNGILLDHAHDIHPSTPPR